MSGWMTDAQEQICKGKIDYKHFISQQTPVQRCIL